MTARNSLLRLRILALILASVLGGGLPYGEATDAGENFCAREAKVLILTPDSIEYQMLARRVQALTEAKDVNVLCELADREGTGELLVHAIAERGESELLHALLARGADINARDRDGYTPVMISVVPRYSYSEGNMFDLMVRGADPFLKNRQGKEALDLLQDFIHVYEKQGLARTKEYSKLRERESALIRYKEIFRQEQQRSSKRQR